MVTAQEALTNMQSQALDAIKSGQNAAVEAVRTWSQTVSKVTPDLPAATPTELPASLTEAIGDPTAIVDSVYDFTAKLIEANKEFVHQLLAAAGPAPKTAAPAAAKPTTATK